jgi:serine/threonine-protein kinase
MMKAYRLNVTPPLRSVGRAAARLWRVRRSWRALTATSGFQQLPTFWQRRLAQPRRIALVSSGHPLTLEAGYLLGPYRVLAPIGAGGMGEVYRARDTKLDRDIALKILPPDVASVETLRRFEKEARAASSLNHPNIVAIYDVGRHESIAYIAMELVEGQTLRGVMSDPLPMKEALRVASKVADVLASAHERGVVHRDLKPENVMISRDGYIKLLDFGLAKIRPVFASGDKTEPQTTAGHIFGTTSYMSPEQAAGRPVDFRSDQFSLGVILYEMLAGKRPFERATGAETLAAVIRDEPPPLAQFNPAAAAQVQPLLDRCLAKSPGDRYASTRDLAHDLRELRNQLTLGSTSGRSYRAMRIEAPKLPLIATVVSALLIAVVTSMVFNHSRSEPVKNEPARAIAIMPFRDLSGGDGQVFSDGISEMISARISQARGVRVIAPFESSIPANADPRDVARRRGATMVLKGSVQRVGDHLRVSYQVIDVASGNRVAGDMVTAPSADIFTLEDLVADGVLQSLNLARVRRAPHAMASALSGADQRAYTEAVGLLQRYNDGEALDRAITSLESLLSNARDSATVNGTLGRALLRKYKMTRNRALVDQAAVYAERAVQLDPQEPEAHVTVGELRRVSGRPADAIASFQKALSLQPNSVTARLGLADALAAIGRAADADRAYMQALQMAPDQPDVYGFYGAFCYSHGRPADAARYFTKQTQLLPNAPRAYANLGAAHQALGHYEEALRAYQRSIEIHPSSGGYSNLGTCQYFLGRYDAAAAAFEKAAEITPKNFIVWANLGDAYRRTTAQRAKAKEAYAKAIQLAHEATAINPQDAVARAIGASSQAKTGETASAERQLKMALETDPTNADVLYQAAIVANLRGDTDSALGWLQRAIASGYTREDAARDPEFANLQRDPRFTSALSPPKRSA